jgi:DNA segregation ATPase FtsK/SpoIIIE, S-DNA-T family
MATTKKKSSASSRASSSGKGGKTTAGKRTGTSSKSSAPKTQPKKTGAAAKSPAKSRSASTAAKKSATQPQMKKPWRREIWGVVFLLLGVFAAFGYFGSVGGVVIDGYCGLLKGLLGYGFWIAPPAMLIASGILLLHKGRPVLLRTICTLLLPILGGGLLHVILCKQSIALGGKMFSALWTAGKAMTAGGAVSGVLAVVLTTGFSRVGAGFLYVVAIIVCCMIITRCTPSELMERLHSGVDSARERVASRPAYRPEDYYEEDEADEDYEEYAEEEYVQPVPQRAARRRGFDVDIVLPGEKPRSKAKKKENEDEEELFDSTPGVPLPHEVLQEEMQKASKKTSARGRKAGRKTSETSEWDFSDNLDEESAPQENQPEAEPAFEVEEPSFDEESAPVEEAVSVDERVYDEPDEPDEPMEEQDFADLAALLDEHLPQAEEEAPVEEEIADEPEVQPVPSAPVRPAMSASATAVAAALANDRPKAEEKPTAQSASAAPTVHSGAGESGDYQYPPVDLLNAPTGAGTTDARSELESTRDLLDDTIKSFGIDAPIINVTRGPSVTRYELELPRGVKLSKLTNLAGDIALALGASSVRIEPITGRNSVVGIEVPNRIVTPVPIREVIDSREFRTHSSKVAFAVGKDISGRNVVGNISRLPHVLIAGTTGSGKSVCTNSMIISLLYKSSPEDVRLIMVDPKMVELGIYNGIPHLLIPVVTDPKKAAGALQWAVTEMMKRYNLFSEEGARDLSSYNTHVLHQGEPEKKMPQIVIFIDELADLMMVAAKEVEQSIMRLAQMGRAAGMHLVVATQRPSTDIITGLMKANIPSRIAFAVSSSTDSRIILDATGAEKLVGKGDMLYAPLGIGKPQRVQGCIITDEEVAAVVDFIKQNSTANYDDSVMQEVESNAQMAEKPEKDKGGKAPANAPSVEGSAEEADEMLGAAIDAVVDAGMASVSYLQRKLKLGYARAARLVDQMEQRGIVGEYNGSSPRKVNITRDEWQAIKAGETAAAAGEDDEAYAQALAMSQAADAEDAEENEYNAEGDEAPF